MEQSEELIKIDIKQEKKDNNDNLIIIPIADDNKGIQKQSNKINIIFEEEFLEKKFKTEEVTLTFEEDLFKIIIDNTQNKIIKEQQIPEEKIVLNIQPEIQNIKQDTIESEKSEKQEIQLKIAKKRKIKQIPFNQIYNMILNRVENQQLVFNLIEEKIILKSQQNQLNLVKLNEYIKNQTELHTLQNSKGFFSNIIIQPQIINIPQQQNFTKNLQIKRQKNIKFKIQKLSFECNNFKWQNVYKINSYKYIYTPLNLAIQNTSTVEITNNFNEKVQINLPQLPFAMQQQEQQNDIQNPQDNIMNPFDLNFRNFTFANIQKQNKQQNESKSLQLQKLNENKQQTSSIKRTCGVSYVKQKESHQYNVNHIYQTLPQLVIQASTGCDKIDVPDIFDQFYKDNFINKGTYIIATFFESEDEQLMRDYCLYNQQRGKMNKNKFFLLNSIEDIHLFFIDKYFLCLHFNFDSQNIVLNRYKGEKSQTELAKIAQNSDILIGFNVRKGISGKKSFLKTLQDQKSVTENEFVIKNEDEESIKEVSTNFKEISNQKQDQIKEAQKKSKLFETNKLISQMDQNILSQQQRTIQHLMNINIDKPNINTCSIRMEMYFPEQKWKSLTKDDKNKLNAFIIYLKDQLELETIEMMAKRFQISTNKCEEYFNQQFLNVKYPKNDTLQILILQKLINKDNLQKAFANIYEMPLYFIDTRDCFCYDPVEKISYYTLDNRNIQQTDYYFDKDYLPSNFKGFEKNFPNKEIGVTAYNNVFTHEELLEIEKYCYDTEIKCLQNQYLPQTAQVTCTSEKIRRTKFFFGYRYIWTRTQIAEPQSSVGAGIRSDVSPVPAWIINKVSSKLEELGIIKKDFLNSFALNVYHDGKEGLAQHFDDAVRFQQPIFSLRLFSDCRLSFGSQLYGFCNGAFCIPLPRGCILKMGEGTYAANGVKHCVRPCDMKGKSATIILRQMHSNVVQEAEIYDKLVDFPCYYSTLSSKQQMTCYSDQKAQEGTYLLNKKV